MNDFCLKPTRKRLLRSRRYIPTQISLEFPGSVLLKKDKSFRLHSLLSRCSEVVISLNKLKLVSLYIVTYLLQPCIHLGLSFYEHKLPQLRSSHLWSGIPHKYAFHAHEEKSATARNEGGRSGHSPRGLRRLDACHILQGTLVVAINQITSYWQNATGENVSLTFFYTMQVRPSFFSFFVNLNSKKRQI